MRLEENKLRLHGSFHCIIFKFISNMKNIKQKDFESYKILLYNAVNSII